eukprot:2574745-Alexandrium_andersonii.AAC.1
MGRRERETRPARSGHFAGPNGKCPRPEMEIDPARTGKRAWATYAEWEIDLGRPGNAPAQTGP